MAKKKITEDAVSNVLSEVPESKRLDPRHDENFPTWEYYIVDYQGERGPHGGNVFEALRVSDMMNDYGSEGWELVHITESVYLIKMYFKRRKVL